MRPGEDIRSYRLRRGRTSQGARADRDRLWPRYGLDARRPLDPVAVFGRRAPLVVEIGFGMGESTAAMAGVQPEVDVVACEVHEAGVIALLRRVEAAKLTNVRLVEDDAVMLLREAIAPASLAEVRIFFPDPWPKARHLKRRLVSPAFAGLLADRLGPAGRVHLATDWAPYAEHALAALGTALDTRVVARPVGRPVTRFERQGLAAGRPSYDVLAVQREGHLQRSAPSPPSGRMGQHADPSDLISQERHPMNESIRQNTTFPSGKGTGHGYLALPEGGTGPGVIVIQEWWGLTDHIADIADRLAREGFVALAPDLFGGKVAHDTDEAGKLMTELPVDEAAKDLGGAVDFLLGHEAVTSGKVGAIGFCMGGGFVLQLAAQQGDKIGAAVPFYGVGPAVPQSYAGVTAAVQGHYGEKDDFYPAADAKKQAEQISSESGAPVEFFYYDAGHAFHNDENLLGTYSADDATLAFSRAVSFLKANLS